MGISSWWKAKRAASQALAANLALNSDQNVIAEQVPELLGMSDVEGMDYTLRTLREWRSTATAEHAQELNRRLQVSQEAWKEGALTMPYWGNLWVLRTYQADLGEDAPHVAPRLED